MVERIMNFIRTPRLELDCITKHFGATTALKNVNLKVYPGEVLAVVGENGAGKSTLMKIIAGAYKPDTGSMKLDGEPFQPKNPLDARKKGIAMIYQELSLAPHLTVEENIVLGIEPNKWGWIKNKEARKIAENALQKFSHIQVDPRAKLSELPPAAQQLVEIARSIVASCKLIVFDEPTSCLSSNDVSQLFKLIKQIQKNNIAIIYISHFIEEVKEIADRILVLRDGQVAGEGAASEMDIPKIVSLMIGRQVKDLYSKSQRTPKEVVLELNDLAGIKKPESVSLVLRRGEVLGIAGLVGAGRTELLRCIFGLDPIKRGSIKLGVWSGPFSPSSRWQQGVGFLSEDRKNEGLALGLNIAENITLTNLNNLGPLGLVLPSKQTEISKYWIEKLDIKCTGPNQPVHALSGGNQQKVALARLMYHDADILLLDEPTRGIDVGAKALIYQIIDKLATGELSPDKKPKAFIVVSSYLPELLGICDRIAVMNRGKLSKIYPVNEVNEHQLMLEAIS